jgi:hypothetical protein
LALFGLDSNAIESSWDPRLLGANRLSRRRAAKKPEVPGKTGPFYAIVEGHDAFS